VDDKGCQVPFAFTGKFSKITIKIDRPQLTPADIKLLEQEGQRNNRASG
jgi:arylsulfatase